MIWTSICRRLAPRVALMAALMLCLEAGGQELQPPLEAEPGAAAPADGQATDQPAPEPESDGGKQPPAPTDVEGKDVEGKEHEGKEDHKKEHGKEHAGDGKEHAGDGENPYDLTHSNALPSQDRPDEWKFDLAIYTLIVFLLLLVILLKFAWGPIMGALAKREGRIAGMIEEAEQSAEKAVRQQLAAYEEKLAAAHQEADQIVSRATQAAGEQADKILDEARAASQREKESALNEIELAKNEALGEVTQKSVDIALGLAKGIVGRELKAEDHDSLIKAALEKFPS